MQAVSSRPFLRLAVLGALVAALGLAACGRKGPLDPPPSASVTAPAEEPAPRSGLASSPVGVSPLGGHGGSATGSSEEIKGPKRKLPLDVLLN